MRVKGAWQPVFRFVFVLVTAVGWVVPWITPRYNEVRPVHVSYSRVQQYEKEKSDIDAEEKGFEEQRLRQFD